MLYNEKKRKEEFAMSLVNIKEMLIRADQENYAVPQFNVWNLEWISAVLTTCQELRTPVILGVSVNRAKYMGGYLVASQMIQAYMNAQAIRVPVALHLDHAPTFEDCKEAIDAGFTSVMIDASREELTQNIEITRKVVDYAHSRNVSVEAELGRVGGKEEQIVAESSYVIPEECLELVQKTGIDALAPALGSVHGYYRGEPKLGFDRMEEIHRLISLPLVLHGGSGLPEDQLKKAIRCGTAKINVNTDCLDAWAKILRRAVKEAPDEIDPRKLIGPGKKGIAEVIRTKCAIFGSIGKGER